MASGIPWSRALIAATAGAFSLVTAEAGPDRDRPLDEQTDGRVLTERDQVDRPTRRRHASSARCQTQLAGVRRRRQARDRVLLLARDVQDGTARHDALMLRRGAQQVGRRSARRRRPARSCRGRGAGACRAATRRAISAIGPRRCSRRRPGRSRSVARRASDRGSVRAARRRRRPGSRRTTAPRAGARAASCRSRPARSASAAGSCQQPGGRLELRIATDEGRQLGRQVVRAGVRRAERAGSRTEGRRR